jgi:hypothetical protein
VIYARQFGFRFPPTDWSRSFLIGNDPCFKSAAKTRDLSLQLYTFSSTGKLLFNVKNNSAGG